MSLPGSELRPDELRDVRLAWPTRRVDEVRGRLMRFVTDEVTTFGRASEMIAAVKSGVTIQEDLAT